MYAYYLHDVHTYVRLLEFESIIFLFYLFFGQMSDCMGALCIICDPDPANVLVSTVQVNSVAKQYYYKCTTEYLLFDQGPIWLSNTVGNCKSTSRGFCRIFSRAYLHIRSKVSYVTKKLLSRPIVSVMYVHYVCLDNSFNLTLRHLRPPTYIHRLFQRLYRPCTCCTLRPTYT